MSASDIGDLLAGSVVTQSSTVYSLDLGQGVGVTFTGSGFEYDSAGHLIDGEITGISNTYQGQAVYQAASLSVSVDNLTSWAQTGLDLPTLEKVETAFDTLAKDAANAARLAGDQLFNGGALSDLFYGGTGNNTIFGGDGADTVSASISSGLNYLRGGLGGDLILGGAGYDDVNGNQGDDSINGGEGGNDWLLGGQGNDIVISVAGNVIINGNLGNDTLDGGSGDDIIRGGQGNDVLSGGAGNDLLFGDRGDDTIAGGAGADIFHVSTSGGHDVIVDFDAAEGDRLLLDPGATYTVSQVGDDTVVDIGGGAQVTLVGVQSASLPAGWVIGV